MHWNVTIINTESSLSTELSWMTAEINLRNYQ